MHRTDADGNVANMFDEGDPGVPTQPTQIDADWLNAVQEELANAVEGAGLTLDKPTTWQLRNVIELMYMGIPPGGRLTLTSGTPVTTADVTAAGTVYFAPCRSAKIPIYNGSRWTLETFAQLSNVLANSTVGSAGPAAGAAGKNYDFFVWSNAGVLTLTRGPFWTSDTARGTGAGTTELWFQSDNLYTNGRDITNGPSANRGTYVGTVRTAAGGATVSDSKAFRHVWNMYNRVRRQMLVYETGDYDYSTATIRQANANTANCLDFVRGMNEDPVTARLQVAAGNSTSTERQVAVGIGLDVTNAFNLTDGIHQRFYVSSTAFFRYGMAQYNGIPGLGRHRLNWNEMGAGADTQHWYGSNGGDLNSAIVGECMC